jgi:hypothetical protein
MSEQAKKDPSVTKQSLIDPIKAGIDVKINIADLDSALTEHAALELHYGLKCADARRQHDRLKTGLEILEARLDAEYRKKFADEGTKVTEKVVDAAVTNDERHIGLANSLIEARAVWEMCEAVASSFRSRKDLLLEIARDRRKEREGELYVNGLKSEIDARAARVVASLGKTQ